MLILKSLINGKSSKTQKDDDLVKIKRIVKPKNELSEVLVVTFSWPGESKSPFRPSRQLLHCNRHFNYHLNKNDQCLKSLLQLMNIKASKLQQSNDIYQAENSSRKAENLFVNNFKIADCLF